MVITAIAIEMEDVLLLATILETTVDSIGDSLLTFIQQICQNLLLKKYRNFSKEP